MGKPDSRIVICSGVRLNSKYEHSIYFPSVDAQREYFAGKAVKTFSAVSYVRRFWDLKVDADIEEARFWNYVYVINGQNPNDYQYYFINNIEYNNEHSVILKLELDVIQTYLSRCTLQPCFVERQHVTDDTIGANTIEEGLDVGTYKDNLQEDLNDTKNLAIVALSTIDLDRGGGCYGQIRNGVFNRAGLYLAEVSDATSVSDFLGSMETDGNIDAILNMWMFPRAFWSATKQGNNSSPFKSIMGQGDLLEWQIYRPNTLDGYAPRNNKLYTYPYNLAYITNNSGGSAVYRYEFSDDKAVITFDTYSAGTPDGGILLYPKGYKGIDENKEEGISLTGFPTCAWSADEYKIWLAQNLNQLNLAEGNAKIQAGFGIVAGVGSAIAGIATANPLMIAGGIGGAVSAGYSNMMKIQEINAQKQDRDLQPPQARGQFSGSLNIASGRQTFTACTRTVRAETAKVIDDYFSLYGYKINRVQIPNIHARELYTYVKTVGCHIHGNLNNADLSAIENVFNNGITFWTDGDQIGNYLGSDGTMKNNPIL